MCGVVAYIGNVPKDLLTRVVNESDIRGLHNLGVWQKTGMGLYHTRYCTSGEDHQPIIVEDRALIFNGVIDMGTKEEMEEKYKVTMTTDNDGELLLRICRSVDDMIEFLREPSRTFAGAVIKGDTMVLIRNSGRPLWIVETEDWKLAASTRDIFKRAGCELEPRLLEPLKPEIWTL